VTVTDSESPDSLRLADSESDSDSGSLADSESGDAADRHWHGDLPADISLAGFYLKCE
jgi:hypothetical protein